MNDSAVNLAMLVFCLSLSVLVLIFCVILLVEFTLDVIDRFRDR